MQSVSNFWEILHFKFFGVGKLSYETFCVLFYRNGKVCWCVTPDGQNHPQSIGPADSINCTNVQRQRGKRKIKSLKLKYLI